MVSNHLNRKLHRLNYNLSMQCDLQQKKAWSHNLMLIHRLLRVGSISPQKNKSSANNNNNNTSDVNASISSNANDGNGKN